MTETQQYKVWCVTEGDWVLTVPYVSEPPIQCPNGPLHDITRVILCKTLLPSIPTETIFQFNNNTKHYIDSKTEKSWVTAANYDYAGDQNKCPIVKISALCSLQKDTDSGIVELYNTTTGDIIASLQWVGGTINTPITVSTYTISNVPSVGQLLGIRFRRLTGTGKVHLHNFGLIVSC